MKHLLVAIFACHFIVCTSYLRERTEATKPVPNPGNNKAPTAKPTFASTTAKPTFASTTTRKPTSESSVKNTIPTASKPTLFPTNYPQTVTPTSTSNPSGTPQSDPTAVPSNTNNPSGTSQSNTSNNPSSVAQSDPTAVPSSTSNPSGTPQSDPTAAPSSTSNPSGTPQSDPTAVPSSTSNPSGTPQSDPTKLPSAAPTTTQKPSYTPSNFPTAKPSVKPSVKPTSKPSPKPTSKPTTSPSSKPSSQPTPSPTNPTSSPTASPSPLGSICQAYQTVKSEFDSLMTNLNGQTKSDIFGKAARLAFHDAGEFSLSATDAYGPDGCLSQSTGDNAGLIESDSIINTVFEPIYTKVKSYQLSRADFWVLMAKFSIEEAETTDRLVLPFQYGRVDNTACELSISRLPNAQMGRNMLTQVFVTQMGLTLDDATTLLGAHSLGRVHPTTSGYGATTGTSNDDTNTVNAWDATPAVFDNTYYINLIRPAWVNNAATSASTTKNEWLGPANTIMLNTDMCLAFPANTAENISPQGSIGQVCGGPANPTLTCTNPTNTKVPTTRTLAQSFAASNNVFLDAFATSFTKMTTVGYGTSGRLGSTLTDFDLTKCA
eukprot:gene11324-15188_t